MAKRFISGPRYFLGQPKISVKKRGIPKAKEEVVLIAGMNQPETLVNNALQELKINFIVQQSKYGGATLGGAKLDFFLPDYNVDLEFNGPFHGTSEGRARDVLRTATLARDGIRLVVIDHLDMDHLKEAIISKIGVPLLRTPDLYKKSVTIR